MIHPYHNYFDYRIYSGNLTQIFLEDRLVINTLNQYSFCLAELDQEFKEALLQADILLPDGIGVVWSNNFLNQKKITKIAGADLHSFLLEKINVHSGKCFYIGSSKDVLEKIRQKITIQYPKIKLKTYSPPFKTEFTEEETLDMIENINKFDPDVLFVGMTAPKQEKWVNKNRAMIKAKVICSIGAVFDFYAGNIQRPGNIWIQLGLEWFVRFVKEPNRMWKRYFYYGPLFIHKVLSRKIQK